MQNQQWYSAEQAAQYTGLPTARAFHQVARRCGVPRYKLGARAIRFKREDLDALMVPENGESYDQTKACILDSLPQ